MKRIILQIDKDNPFANCKLGREKYSKVLTSIVEAYTDGFVLAVNSKWGTGKTTFMEMWKQSLENNGYKAIYFNAWENDFVSEPIIAIIGEIKAAFTPESADNFDSIIKKAYKFSSTILPSLAKTVVTLAGLGQISEMAEKISAATIESFNDEISEYEKKKESLSELKKQLSEFIENKCGEKPLVFIVDELDRCRPDYAVEVLEKIKHFFSVNGVVFILSIDKDQLCNSIKGYYGSDRIDSSEYLRRFIDLEYTLPEPKNEDFIRYICNEYRFDDFFNTAGRSLNKISEKEFLVDAICVLANDKMLSLRQIEKMLAQMRIVAKMFKSDDYLHPDLLVLMIYLKMFNDKVYSKISTHSLSIQEVINCIEPIFENIIKKEKIEKNSYKFHIVIAKIVKFYGYEFYPNDTLSVKNNDGTDNFHLSFIVNYLDENYLINEINFMSRVFAEYEIKLSYFTNKINLLESFKSL